MKEMQNDELQGKTVGLKGRDEDLEELSKWLYFDNVCIKRGPGECSNKFYLKCASFDSMDECGEEMLKWAIKFIEMLNGEAQLRSPKFQPVEVAGGIDIFEGDSHSGFFVAPVAEQRAKGIVPEINISDGTESLPIRLRVVDPYFLVKWGINDVNVKEALRHFSKEHSWSNLYKVYEAIRNEVAGYKRPLPKGKTLNHAIWESGLASENEVRSFYDTANFHHRHAYNPTVTPPAHEMSLAHANIFVRELLMTWIQMKHDSS